jgi:hypothetical protein
MHHGGNGPIGDHKDQGDALGSLASERRATRQEK